MTETTQCPHCGANFSVDDGHHCAKMQAEGIQAFGPWSRLQQRKERWERRDDGLYMLGHRLPEGPWHSEPDRVEFEYAGRPCLINRSPMGVWCGYAAVLPGHPWYDVDYSNVPALAHGGITYAHRCQGEICHTPRPGDPDDVYWIGFDCGHAGDLMLLELGLALVLPDWPKLPPELKGKWEPQYRTVEYVTEQTRNLAMQASYITHVLLNGLPLCRFSTELPGNWPKGNNWVARTDANESNCPGCIAAEQALGKEEA